MKQRNNVSNERFKGHYTCKTQRNREMIQIKYFDIARQTPTTELKLIDNFH